MVSRSSQRFRDALALPYGWRPANMATTCVCGHSNDVQHALNCKVGGLPIHRHNNIRDLTASLISEVCPNTEIEPSLQPLTGERRERRSANSRDDSRLDIRCRGFYQTLQDAFFLIYGYSISLQHQTRMQPSNLSIANMNKKSTDAMTNEFEK